MLFAVDLTTGARTVVADRTTGNGATPGYLGLTLDAERALLAGTHNHSIQLLDVITGDRVVVAR